MKKVSISFLALLVSVFAFPLVAQESGSDETLGAAPRGVFTVALEEVASGFAHPMAVVPEPGSDRLFIVDQAGTVKILDGEGTLIEEPFIDLSGTLVQLEQSYDERGLLGFAFHPEYTDNGKVYVYYSVPAEGDELQEYNHVSVLSEFSLGEGGRDTVDIESEQVVLRIPEPQMNHNAGSLQFGPDGYLYVPLGDGGGANDIGFGHVDDWYETNDGGNAQNIEENLLGKIIRIDVDNRSPQDYGEYGIPEDNPFVGADGRDEIWAYGLRNPYHISFDTGGEERLFAVDAGQELWEEVNIIERGANYGWNVKEGAHCFTPDQLLSENGDCPEQDGYGNALTDPAIEFPNTKNPQADGLGLVVVGGQVYRGEALPQLDGAYIFGVWTSAHDTPAGKLYAGVENRDGSWELREVTVDGREGGNLGEYLLALGRDESGEVYALTAMENGPVGESGKVYRISAVQ